MQVERTPIDGLVIITPTVHSDHRGFFFESYNEVRFRELGIDLNWRQDNHAKSTKNTVRGLHFQRGTGQAKLVRCVRGSVWDVAVDIRPDSPTLGKWHSVELSEENKKMFLIPVGFAHGYAVLSEEAETLYKCSNVYDPKLEDTILWNDPDLAVKWPVADPILSKRDQDAQTLKQYLQSLRASR
jgi:dTDP-4-dehydrorhamnose 3,5-epimerase